MRCGLVWRKRSLGPTLYEEKFESLSTLKRLFVFAHVGDIMLVLANRAIGVEADHYNGGRSASFSGGWFRAGERWV